MPVVVSNHQRIYFRFEGERGAFLMLHHGLFGSHQDWYRAGYVAELAKEFRLVIPDARGHGRSDRPTEVADFRPERFAEDLIEIVNGLGIRNLHFLGYGLGALIGLEMLRRFPERVRIAVLGGEAPLMLPPVRDYWRGLADQLGRGTLAELIADLRAQQRLVRWEAADPPEEERASGLALLQAVSEWELHGEERISVTSPVTLFAGSDDPAAERVERARAFVNRARLVLFPGLNHAKLFEERAQITQELVRLLKSGRREDGDSHQRRHGGDSAESRGGKAPQAQRGAERRAGGRDDRAPEQRVDRRYQERRESIPRDFRHRTGDPSEGRPQSDAGKSDWRADARQGSQATPPGPPPGGGAVAQHGTPDGLREAPLEGGSAEPDAPAEQPLEPEADILAEGAPSRGGEKAPG
jgi:pimeloyl-ACP methyl ester carboxylesterase